MLAQHVYSQRPMRSPASVRATLSSGRSREVVHLSDLSFAGAGFVGPSVSAKVGSEVTLRFELPVDGMYVRVEVRGEVRHQKRMGKPSFGVRFLRLSYEAQKAITSYLNR